MSVSLLPQVLIWEDCLKTSGQIYRLKSLILLLVCFASHHHRLIITIVFVQVKFITFWSAFVSKSECETTF